MRTAAIGRYYVLLGKLVNNMRKRLEYVGWGWRVTNNSLYVLVKVGLTEKTLKEVRKGAMQIPGGRAFQAEANAKTAPSGRTVWDACVWHVWQNQEEGGGGQWGGGGVRAVGDEVKGGGGEDVCRLLQGLWLSFCVNWRVLLEPIRLNKVIGPLWLLCGE